MREKSRAGQLRELQRLLAALQVHQVALPHLETQLAQLDTLVGQAEYIFQSQAALAASKQEASQKLASLLTDSLRLATVLRFELKQFYGRPRRNSWSSASSPSAAERGGRRRPSQQSQPLRPKPLQRLTRAT